MSSIGYQIMQKVMETLNSGTPQGVPAAMLDRVTPVGIADLPALDVLQMSESVEPATGRTSLIAKRSKTFKVQAIALDTVTIDAMQSWAISALFKDETFGGLALMLVENGSEWEKRQGEVDYLACVTTFTVEYQTKRTTQESS